MIIDFEASFLIFTPLTYEMTDIDECHEEEPCDSNADCSNIEGSYECQCRTGYNGTGYDEGSCLSKEDLLFFPK